MTGEKFPKGCRAGRRKQMQLNNILGCFLEATSRTQRIWVACELHKKQVGRGPSLINIETRIY